MATQIDTAQREIVLVEDAHVRPMMGNQVLESLPSRHIPVRMNRSDPSSSRARSKVPPGPVLCPVLDDPEIAYQRLSNPRCG